MRRLRTAFVVLITIFAIRNACAESFPLKKAGGVLLLPVQINHSITLNFTIDSGATDVVIPQDVFSTLLRTGSVTSKDMLTPGTYELADGSHRQTRRFRIRSLVIGRLELHDIVASVAPAGATLLLGQSFLSHLPGWSIDNRRRLLIVGGADEHNQTESLSAVEQSQSELLAKTNKWIACGQPFESRIEKALKYDNQLAVLYPRFGLLWTQWINLVNRCSKGRQKDADNGADVDDDDPSCDNKALEQAHSDLINRVAATAEPDAIRAFSMTQMAIDLADSERKKTCGEL